MRLTYTNLIFEKSKFADDQYTAISDRRIFRVRKTGSVWTMDRWTDGKFDLSEDSMSAEELMRLADSMADIPMPR